MNTVVEDQTQQSRLLGSHEAELNRIDTAFVGAVRNGTRPPSPAKIFGALTDASIVCAEVIETYRARPIPANVRTELLRLHCAMTDVTVSLKSYAGLSVSQEIRPRTPRSIGLP